MCLWDLTLVLTYMTALFMVHLKNSLFGKQRTSTETCLSVRSGLIPQLVMSSPSIGLLDKQRADVEK